MSKVLSCYWTIFINGKEIDDFRKRCIESIDISEQSDGSDTCTIVVNDPNFYFIEDNIFVEEATVSVVLGWHGDTHRVTFAGYISAIDISFPESGYPSLSIYCLDNSHVMNRKKNKRSWDNVTSADVVKKIAQEYGFKCVAEPGYEFTLEDTISQSDTTDIEFCESLAGNERVPFMCKLVGNTLYYVKKGILKDPSHSLYYKKFPYDVISFSPKINKETKKEEVSSADINTNDKSIDLAVATDSTTSRDVQGSPVKAKPLRASMSYDPSTGTWKEKGSNNLAYGQEVK